MKLLRMIVDKLKVVFRYCIGFVVIILVWLAVCELNLISRYFLPHPYKVLTTFINLVKTGKMFGQLGTSLLRFLQGYLMGSGIGIVVGISMGIVPAIGKFFKPLLTFFNSLSGITWVPLAIAWIGIGDPTINFLIINAVFFMVSVSTLSGVQLVPKVYENAMLTMGATRFQIVTQVILPGSLAHIITGLRVGAGFAWRSLIAAEMAVGSSGIGFMAFKASYDHQQDVLLASILVVGVVAIILDTLLLEPLERRTIQRWGIL
jgi:ABC-type nitrate/sulfonate/bicarbonate transport system permease component